MVSTVTCDWTEDCVHIRFARNHANTLTTEVLLAFSAALDDARRGARGIMLCGGDKFFSNGVDLEWALTRNRAEIRHLFLTLGECIVKLLETPVPVVGVIRGHAVGAAMAMFMACDYRYAAKGRVLIGKPEILLGVPNPYYGDQLLRFVAGDFIASDLIYTGKLVTAEEGIALKLLHAVGEKSAIEGVAGERLRSLCELAPEAFAESKHMRLGSFIADLRDQMSSRVARQVEIWFSDDAQSRLRVAAQRLARKDTTAG